MYVFISKMKPIVESCLLLICSLHLASSCYLFKEQIVCARPAEITAEGNDTWTDLMLFTDTSIKFDLKDSFKRTPNIKKLTLASINSIEPGALKSMKKLDKLVFFKITMEEIPTEVLDDLPIRFYQVFQTGLKYLRPGCFNKIPDLINVDIRHNNIREIKAGIFNNLSILKVYLNDNGIEVIEENAFTNMNELIYLHLGGNKISTFSSERLLGNSASLNQLWLNRNKFTRINKEMFKTVPNLLNLYLEINDIDTMEDNTFELTPSLDFLDLSNNKLIDINSKVFPVKGMKKLRLMLLHNNKLTFINKAIFIKLPALGYISYGGNPFQCSCLHKFENWLIDKNVSRLCDQEYSNGLRPSCVVSKYYPHECLYDTDLTQDLHEPYTEMKKQYPDLPLKCDTTPPHGVGNAVLGFVE